MNMEEFQQLDSSMQLNQIYRELKCVKESQESIEVVLTGDKKSANPDGIIHRVARNTSFRETWQRLFWILVVALTGMTTSIILLLIGKG